MNPDAKPLIQHPEAPHGWDEHGNILDKPGWDARYTKPDHPDGTPGGVDWPGNAGAVNGTRAQYWDLDALLRDYPEFAHLARLGRESGAYLTVRGTPFELQGLTPGHPAFELKHYDLTGTLPAGFRAEISRIAPANGFPGGGVQLRFLEMIDGQWKEVAVENAKQLGLLT